jgi:pyridinium-3,5-bisthiocarboxylic acid mononucleotide nickel chelatase
MARVLWVDAGNGAAGDMLLAALLDAGADPAFVHSGLSRLGLGVTLDVSETRRHGLRARHVRVDAPPAQPVRHLADVLAIVGGTGFAATVFTTLAEAEARVHGVSRDDVHFHEVGALDAIADIVGCGLALESLGLLAGPVTVSPVAVGSGKVRTSHGWLTVPAPGTLELLVRAGAPIAAHHAEFELCTPTGAALLTALATGWGPVPAGTVHAVGVGAGSADPDTHANVLRVLVIEPEAEPDPGGTGDRYVVEATIDDLDPRLWPDVLDGLHEAGAEQAWCTTVLMRKGRPGQVLTAVVPPHALDAVTTAAFRLTTTLGLRVHPVTALGPDGVVAPVDVEDLAGRGGEPVG